MRQKVTQMHCFPGKGSSWLDWKLESFICGFQSETSPKLCDNYTHLPVMAEPVRAHFLGDEQPGLPPCTPAPGSKQSSLSPFSSRNKILRPGTSPERKGQRSLSDEPPTCGLRTCLGPCSVILKSVAFSIFATLSAQMGFRIKVEKHSVSYSCKTELFSCKLSELIY